MGGWRILALYLLACASLLVLPFLRGRVLLLPGRLLPSAHFFLMALLLLDAAAFPLGISELPVPMAAAAALTALSLAFRHLSFLVGFEGERALDLLEGWCAREGIETVREGERLVLKRLGAAVERIPLGRGVDLLRLDRRRREPELDRIQREWRRALSGRKREEIR